MDAMKRANHPDRLNPGMRRRRRPGLSIRAARSPRSGATIQDDAGGVPVRPGPDPGAGAGAALSCGGGAGGVQLWSGPGEGEPRAAGGGIRAHVILCWLALLLARITENTCGATWPSLRRELDRIAVGTFNGPAGTFRQRTEISPAQHDILDRLGISPPPKIYQLTPATTADQRKHPA